MYALDTNRSPHTHQRLRAYGFALEFYRAVKAIRAGLPRGLGPLGDQISRAAQSLCLNLAEGAAQRSRPMKRRYYLVALGSASECAAALDLLTIEEAATAGQLAEARRALDLATVMTLGLTR